MEQSKTAKATFDKDEVRRLVSNAESSGEHDTYAGKRNSIRFAEGLQLEVTDDPSKHSVPMAVTMHNASNGGCAFWCKRKLELRSRLFLREFSADNSLPWLPAHVTHCTQGIRGFLVGVAFGERPRPSPQPSP
ncbi:MAG: PilZ domain-containing protein [Phycisphaerales bacterium]|jgi:hypothetical protein|nr:PilZ domain-containing protein [Phycisphaerales bacterium]